MLEKFIDFETAKIAKLKGFDWKTEQSYDGVGMILHQSWNWAKHPALQPRCHQALLQQWLRDRRQLHPHICYIESNIEDRFGWFVSIYKLNDKNGSDLVENSSFTTYFSTYEQALEWFLAKAFEIL